jgi:putative spermidine/putrescine transport system ATP-binding protein
LGHGLRRDQGRALSAIEFKHVVRAFGATRAVDDVSFAIAGGEFFSMLGPSGSGKTTCLRLIAGFDLPDSGQVLLDGADVSRVPPYDRNVNTVFQDYALFPHMNVAENVAYGLRVRRVGKAQRLAKAAQTLALVKLESLAARRPNQLSGGQRQRVALARALINEPKVLLLDEPLGALDLKLREEMQIELKSLQRELGITFVYVTHDQGEALSMSDRVAVFNHGRVEQIDTPRRLYDAPRTAFVARFVGSSNVIAGALARSLTGNDAPFAIRAEKISMTSNTAPQPADAMLCPGRVLDVQYHGADSRFQVQAASGDIITVARGESTEFEAIERGSDIHLSWSRRDMVSLERDGA